MVKKKHTGAVLLLGAAHFLVDFSCTALLTLMSKSASAFDSVLCAIVYNGLAFAFQLPIGALADKLRISRLFSVIGCLLVVCGFLFQVPLLACILIGLGNACFHIGGGREALKRGGKHTSQVGKFVGPGALGIFLGPLSAAAFPWLRFAAPVLLFLCAAVLFPRRNLGGQIEALSISGLSLSRGRLAVIVACMFLTVLLRSYMGTVLHYEFQSQTVFAAFFVLCIFGGKFFGGILADRFGIFRFALISQLSCTVLLVLSVCFPFCAMPAIFLFNTTMAITASVLYRCVPSNGGTMFGLTTFALFLGVVPKLLGWGSPLFTWWGLLLLGLCSTGFLLAGLYLVRKERCHAG